MASKKVSTFKNQIEVLPKQCKIKENFIRSKVSVQKMSRLYSTWPLETNALGRAGFKLPVLT
jgi:hypothetical protein